jgi:iron complex outermembrane recepter protein
MDLHRSTWTRCCRYFSTICFLSLLLQSIPSFALDLSKKVDFNVPSQPLASAVIQFSKQADIQFLISGQKLDSVSGKAVRGSYTIEEGLKLLLDGTGFCFKVVGENTITLTSASTAAAELEAPKTEANLAPSSAATATLQKVEVAGSRLSRAGAEGAQDVKIYNRERIDQSGQSTVSDFLNTLPEVSLSSVEATYLATSVKLRGLPEGSTLILINGRRVQSSSGNSSAFGFFDLNLIPLAAVERVEVLPTGSSAVYGGDALAGVVNIVLKKDFVGTSLPTGHWRTRYLCLDVVMGTDRAHFPRQGQRRGY